MALQAMLAGKPLTFPTVFKNNGYGMCRHDDEGLLAFHFLTGAFQFVVEYDL